MLRLSERLKIVYANLLPQKDVWDICCDHGYLGIAAYQSMNFSGVFFVDQVAPIIENLKNEFQTIHFKAENKTKAAFVCSAGQNIDLNLTGTVSITGVGGFTIFKILDGLSKNNRLNADRLVLGPHRDEVKLIELIKESSLLNKYKLKSEIKIIENDYKRSLLIFDLMST